MVRKKTRKYFTTYICPKAQSTEVRNWKNNANKELPGEKWESGNKITSFWHQQPFAIGCSFFWKKIIRKALGHSKKGYNFPNCTFFHNLQYTVQCTAEFSLWILHYERRKSWCLRIFAAKDLIWYFLSSSRSQIKFLAFMIYLCLPSWIRFYNS